MPLAARHVMHALIGLAYGLNALVRPAPPRPAVRPRGRPVPDAPAAERGRGRLLLRPLLPGELAARLRCAAADEAFGLERGLGGTTLAHGPGPPGAVQRP